MMHLLFPPMHFRLTEPFRVSYHTFLVPKDNLIIIDFLVWIVKQGSTDTVSAKRKFRNISRPHAATQLVFLVQFYMVIIDYIS